MLGDGLKVLKYYKIRSSKHASPRVLQYAPNEHGGALTWRKLSRQIGAKPSGIVMATVNQVEREV